MKILNLYCGIGGNRKLWGEEHSIVAVELNPQIAKIYQDFFPDDKVIVADAHQYLLDHFKEFDFIWSSPPCPSHSKVRFMGTKAEHPTCGTVLKKVYPDMALYQEIIFLRHYCETKYVVENVVGYYEPLISPQEVHRHYFWTNFHIGNFECGQDRGIGHSQITGKTIVYGVDLSPYKLSERKDQILRNMVNPYLGLHILNESKRNIQPELFNNS